MSSQNPYLKGGNETEERTQTVGGGSSSQPDPDVIEAFRELTERVEALEEETADVDEDLEQLGEEIEAVTDDVDELQETEEFVEDHHGEIVALWERVDEFEGDVTCSACGGQVRSDYVQEVFQDGVETDSSFFNKTEFTGPVNAIRCPICGGLVSIEDHPIEERVRLTDKLRRAGVADGEVTDEGEENQAGDDVDDDADDADDVDDDADDGN